METNLAATQAARKERLIALRRRKEGAENGEAGPSHFTFKQRNYDPQTRQMRKRDAAASAGGQNGQGGEEEEDTVEKAVEGLAEQIIQEDEAKRQEELDLFNIQPRRANWDLKRDMNARMGRLERRTNEAVATIFRQRLQAAKKDSGSSDQVDLVASINAQQTERDAQEREDADAASSGDEAM